MVTRSIWRPAGILFGWNATEAALFGAAESGVKVAGILKTTVSGPAWLSGGTFGLEASLVAVVWCVLAAAVMLRLARRNGRWEPARLNPSGRLALA